MINKVLDGPPIVYLPKHINKAAVPKFETQEPINNIAEISTTSGERQKRTTKISSE